MGIRPRRGRGLLAGLGLLVAACGRPSERHRVARAARARVLVPRGRGRLAAFSCGPA